MKAKRELNEYWKKHKAEEMLVTTRVSVMEKNAQRDLNKIHPEEN
jgi:hypothetical protein